MECYNKRNGKKYTCAPKINLRDREGRNVIGYCIDEDGEDVLKVKIQGQRELVNVCWPEYDELEGCFRFRQCNRVSWYSVTEFWPVQMKLRASGQSSFIISVCTLGDDE